MGFMIARLTEAADPIKFTARNIKAAGKDNSYIIE